MSKFMDCPSPLAQKALSGILSALPEKSILRFKAVSKDWDRLISSSDFITVHLRRSSLNPSLLVRRYHIPSAYSGILQITNPTGCFNTQFLAVPLKEPPATFPRIVGSVNGLVCLDVSPCNCCDFILWNPGTRQSKQLPSPLITCTASNPFRFVFVGFGFDPLNNDFKIVRIVYFKGHGNLAVARYEVYSWKKDSWKELGYSSVFDMAQICGQYGVFVENSLNWTGIEIGSTSGRYFVVSFDMGTEVFERIEFQPMVTLGVGSVRLMSYRGLLAIALHPLVYATTGDNRNHFEFWVRYDYGEGRKTWIRVGTNENFPVSWVLQATWRNNELVIKYTGKGDYETQPYTFLYDPVDKRRRRLPVYYDDSDIQCYSHVKSLVPVDGRIYDVSN